jgi:hypothetical protein
MAEGYMRSWIGGERERRLAERHVPQPWFVKGITVRSRLMQPSDYGINSLIRYPTTFADLNSTEGQVVTRRAASACRLTALNERLRSCHVQGLARFDH